MYIFVRFAAIVTIIFGVLLMLAGVGATIYGIVQNPMLTEMLNQGLQDTNIRVMNAGFGASIFGLMFFIQGMIVAALGQLLLVFVDIANNTKDTNSIMRSMRKAK